MYLGIVVTPRYSFPTLTSVGLGENALSPIADAFGTIDTSFTKDGLASWAKTERLPATRVPKKMLAIATVIFLVFTMYFVADIG